MNTHAGMLAALLQGAHERRQRAEQARREDKGMSKDIETERAKYGESVWDDDPYVHVMKLVERAGKVLGDIAASGDAPGDPQASAVTAERVVELERQLAEAREGYRQVVARGEDVERQLAERTKHYEDQVADRNKLERKLTDALVRAEKAEGDLAALVDATTEDHSACYGVREVPWVDVAAGMMTISSQGVPFLVQEQAGGTWALEGLHDGKVIRFEKTPNPAETVRVLVPYVTPEQAESLVKNGLGGTAVT